MKPSAMKRSCLAALVCLVVSLFAPHARAQCATQWLPGEGVPGTNGQVYAMTMWDPDGSGPRLPVLVVGGMFGVAGATQVANIATYDPTTGAWSALGSAPFVSVYALTTMPNGDLVASGQLATTGGVTFDIALWNGTSWSVLGSGVDSLVRVMTIMPNGDLVAGGDFTTAGGVSAKGIARWDGMSWSALGSGVAGVPYPSSFNVLALMPLPNGDLVVGGRFGTAGGLSVNNIARWDGTSWSALGSGVAGEVHALTTLPNGDLVAANTFWPTGGPWASSIVRWNGTSWQRSLASVPDLHPNGGDRPFCRGYFSRGLHKHSQRKRGLRKQRA